MKLFNICANKLSLSLHENVMIPVCVEIEVESNALIEEMDRLKKCRNDPTM